MNFVSIADYARLCGVTRTAIEGRIRRKTLTAVKMSTGRDNGMFIDADLFPAELRKAGRPKLILKAS